MIAYLVQHHPARTALLDRLLPALPEGAVVVSDPDPDGEPNPWRTYEACLEAAADLDATHAVILQDDATPCSRFALAVEAAVAARPDRLLVLWHGGQPREHILSIDRALDAGEAWIEMWSRRWVPAVALVWPLRLVCPVVCWVREAEYPPQLRADDETIGNALRALGEPPPLACVPSLVEHDDMQPSLVGQRAKFGLDPARVAHRFIGAGDPLALDWSRGV